MDVDLAYLSDEEVRQEDIDDEELTLLSREFPSRQQANPTSSTRSPLGDEILGGCGWRRLFSYETWKPYFEEPGWLTQLKLLSRPS